MHVRESCGENSAFILILLPLFCVGSYLISNCSNVRAQTPKYGRPLSQPNSNSEVTYASGRDPASQSHHGSGAVTRIPLTLKQTVELALRQNPRRVIARILVDESLNDKDIARSALLPQAEVAARQAIIRFNAQSIIDLPKIGLGNVPLRIGPFQSITGGAVFSQQLVNFGLIRRFQISREGVKAAKYDEASVRESITATVVSQYLQVLQSDANTKAVEARVKLAERLYQQTTRLEKTGVGTTIDTLRARVELQNEKQQLLDAQTAQNTAIYALAELLNLPRNEEPQPTDTMQFYKIPTFNQQDLIDQALTNRPEMKALLSGERRAELARKAASEQRLPTLAFSGFYLYQARRLSTGEPGYTYAFTLNVPLWTSGRIHAEMARASLESKRLEEEHQDLEDAIERQVKTALDQLQSARNAVDAANLGLKLAQDVVARAERRFAAGVTTNIDVITAQDDLARADDNQIKALYRFNQARADLARAEGDAEAVYGR
jgi:outer membrane protein